MTNKIKSPLLVGLLASACIVLTAPASQAFSFHITVTTATLMGSSSAPFALDFQLNGGNPLGNTATISNFTFGTGSATSTPPATPSGFASGDLSTSVSVSDDSLNPFNEFYQGFAPGSTLDFDVSLTTNVNTPTADAFSFAILDKDLLNITTNGGGALVVVNIDNALSGLSSVQTYSGTGAYTGVTATATPEPGTAATLIMGASMLLGLRRRRTA